MAYGPQKTGIRTPHFMPYEPFLLGVGVVFNLLTHMILSGISHQRSNIGYSGEEGTCEANGINDKNRTSKAQP